MIPFVRLCVQYLVFTAVFVRYKTSVVAQFKSFFSSDDYFEAILKR